MSRETRFEVRFFFKRSTNQVNVIIPKSELESIEEELCVQEPFKWISVEDHIINLGEVQYIKYGRY